MSRGDAAEQHSRIERELTEERVAALRRISETLASLITQLNSLRERLGDEQRRRGVADGRVHWSNQSPELAQYRELRRKAVKYRWYLEVQREALGLRHHQGLDEFYRIPDAI